MFFKQLPDTGNTELTDLGLCILKECLVMCVFFLLSNKIQTQICCCVLILMPANLNFKHSNVRGLSGDCLMLSQGIFVKLRTNLCACEVCVCVCIHLNNVPLTL